MPSGYLVKEVPDDPSIAPEVIELAQPKNLIGRTPEAQVMLDNPAVLEHQATIEVVEEFSGIVIELTHLGQGGSTDYEVNGVRRSLRGAGRSAVLQDGSVISIGPFQLTLFLQRERAESYHARSVDATAASLQRAEREPARPPARPVHAPQNDIPDTPRDTFNPPLPDLWRPDGRSLRADPRDHKYINYLPVIFHMDLEELGIAIAPGSVSLNEVTEYEDATLYADDDESPAAAASRAAVSEIEESRRLRRRAPFLWRYLQIMETLWEPREKRQDFIEYYFDPRTCPASFLPWLADWFGIWIPPRGQEPMCRRIIARAMFFYRWRGTAFGLQQLLEAGTGWDSVKVRGQQDVPFFFVVEAERTEEEAAVMPDALVRELIERNKPAACAYRLDLTTRAAAGGKAQ